MINLNPAQLFRQFILILISLGLIIACHSISTSDYRTSNILKVATEPAFPPFQFQENMGELKGFDIDLIKAIGQEAGLEIRFQILPFDQIIPAIEKQTVGAAISGITITPERQKIVSFSYPYFKTGLAIAIQKDNQEINNLESLSNKKIGVKIGTTGANEAKKVIGGKISYFNSTALALQALSKGNVDAVINDKPVILYLINSDNFTEIKVIQPLLTEEYYGIATPKKSENLAKINQALVKVIKTGVYQRIYQQWFKIDPPALPNNQV
jgi:arginine/lysine/histidine/glutamine transport system substrate-binding/permease protein